MLFMPFNVLGIWIRGLFALALLGGGIYLLAQWYQHRETVVIEPTDGTGEEVVHGVVWAGDAGRAANGETVRVVRWEFGWNRETAFLLGGLGLLGWSLGGGWLFSGQGGGWEFPAFWTIAVIVQALLGDGAFALRRLPLVPARTAAAH